MTGKRITQIETGDSFSLAVCGDGTLAVWGNNYIGQLGDGTTTDRLTPIAIQGGALAGKSVTLVAAGSSHALALCGDGTLTSWGWNQNYQLGDGSTDSKKLPIAITRNGALNGKTVTQLASNHLHNLALVGNGTVPTNQAPTIIILTPTLNQTLPLSSFEDDTISGVATDVDGVAKVEIKLYRTRNGSNQIWNGTAFTATSTTVPAEVSDKGTYVNWKMGDHAPSQSQLDAGEYQFIVYATDTLGKMATARSTFTLEGSAPTPDTEKPLISISAPSAKQSVMLADVTSNSIRGIVSDNVGVAKVELKLYRTRNGVNQIWNGTSFTTTSTTVLAELSGSGTTVNWSMGGKTPPQSQLDVGEYQLIAYATDAAGNTSNARVNFSLYVSGTGG